MQAHAATWLLASAAFATAYLLVPTVPPPADMGDAAEDDEAPPPRHATPERLPAARADGRRVELARPLLEGGRPAR